MEIINSTLPFDIENISKDIYIDFDIRDAVFFDIETTGFSSKNTLLYMIGAASYNNEKSVFEIRQWFMNSKADEPIIIEDFFRYAQNYTHIIHYNGNGFDIPYIEAKAKYYNIPYDFNIFTSIDIYKKILPFKRLFGLCNIKQKSIESFLSINRKDIYSGGDLIPSFMDYLNTGNDSSKSKLLQHNLDDICGLINILPIINYCSIYDGLFTTRNIELVNDNDILKEIILIYDTSYKIPIRVSLGNDTYYMTWYGNTLKLCIKVYHGGLKFFYPNYKDYYYLPLEDCSIHKSVAFYVDKNFRTKAKAANCYSKKTGRFLPQCTEIISPYFKIDYEDKTTYFEVTDELISSPETLKDYCLDTLKHLL